MKIPRQTGLQLEGFGCVLITTVMLADRFLFTLQDGFLLACAILSALSLIVGIRAVRRADEEAEMEAQKQLLSQQTQSTPETDR